MMINDENKEIIDKFRRHTIKILKDIIANEYIYSVDNIVEKLNIQRVYIQKEFIKNMETLKLDRDFKFYCRCCMGDISSYKKLVRRFGIQLGYDDFLSLNRDIIELIEASGIDSYKLSRKILISRPQIIKVIENKFMQEFESVNENKEYYQEYYKIDSRHAELILDVGLKDQSDLKEYYDVKTELQVNRRLRKDSSVIFAKYVIPSESDNKRGMARYLTTYDFPSHKIPQAREIF